MLIIIKLIYIRIDISNWLKLWGHFQFYFKYPIDFVIHIVPTLLNRWLCYNSCSMVADYSLNIIAGSRLDVWGSLINSRKLGSIPRRSNSVGLTTIKIAYREVCKDSLTRYRCRNTVNSSKTDISESQKDSFCIGNEVNPIRK